VTVTWRIRTRLTSYRFRWTELHLELIFPPHFSATTENDIAILLDQIEREESSSHQDEALARQDRYQLERLYPTYDRLYERNTQQITATKNLQRALQFALACRGQLTMDLLIGAVDIDPNKDGEPNFNLTESYMRRLASNFLVVDEDKMVHFAHVSVKEYLQYSEQKREIFSDTRTNIDIAASCLTILVYQHHKLIAIAGMKRSPRLTLGPGEGFLNYSAWNWGSHCARAGKNGRQESPLKRRFEQFMLGDDIGEAYLTWRAWAELSRWTISIDSETSDPFWAACIWGFPEVVETVIRHRPKVLNTFTKLRQSGLHLASRYGHTDIATQLLAAGLYVNSRDTMRQTPLHIACEWGHADVIQVLLNEENRNLELENRQGLTPWEVAAGNNHPKAMMLLDSAGADTRDAMQMAFRKLDHYRGPDGLP
jgi:hypothetical protein